jgi:hypothetical protein
LIAELAGSQGLTAPDQRTAAATIDRTWSPVVVVSV